MRTSDGSIRLGMAPMTRPQLDENKFYVDYGTYAKLRGKIRMAE